MPTFVGMATDTNIDALVAAYQTLVDALTDTLANAKAQVALDNFKLSAYAFKSTESRQVTMYGIAGRQHLFEKSEQARIKRDAAEAELEAYLGRGGGANTYVDLSGSIYRNET